MKLRPSLQLDGLQLKDTGQLENFINKKIAIKQFDKNECNSELIQDW